MIVLGGFFADAADRLVESTRTDAQRRFAAPASEGLRLVAGTLANDGPAPGAGTAGMPGR